MIIIFWLSGQIVLTQDRKTYNNYTGEWESPLSWNPSWAEPQSNVHDLDVTINGLITANSPLRFSGDSKLIINDTLVIKGDITIYNNNQLQVNEGGILIVFGNMTFSNKSDITADGYIVITGNLIKEGTVDEGSFKGNDDPVRVFIGGTVSPESLLNDESDFELLNCVAPSDPYPHSGCSNGNMEDLANDQIYQFFLTHCINATAGSNSPVCPGNTINLSSSGGTYYSWSGPVGFSSTFQNPTLPEADTAMAGTYTVEILNELGCSDEISFNITVNPPPEIVITNPSPECYPATAYLTEAAVTAGSLPGLTWSYYTGPEGTEEYPTPGEATDGIWYIKGTTLDGCFDIKPVSVIIHPPVTGNVISGDTELCHMDSPELSGISDLSGGNGEFRYKWESTGSDLNWETGAGSANSKGYIAPPLDEPAYFRRIVLSGTNDECRDTSNISGVGLHPFSYAEIAGITDTICDGDHSELSFSLQGEGPWNLVYSDGTDNYSLEEINQETHISYIHPTTNDSATYLYHIVSLTDRYGCQALANNISGQAGVRVYGYPEPDAGYPGDVCGNIIQLNASPSFGRGEWYSDFSTAVFDPGPDLPDASATVTEYGTHNFTWTETNWQCSASTDVSVSFYEQPEEVFAGYDKVLQFIFEAELDAVIPDDMPEAYGVWDVIKGDGKIVFPGEPDTRVTNLGFGENIFTWTLFNGLCKPVSVPVTLLIADLGIPNAFSPNNSGSNDMFIIKGIENSSYNKLTVFNRQGNIVFSIENYRNDWDGRNHNGIPLPEDTFFYILEVDNQYSYNGYIVLKR